jgi:FkbM family methyltransferase
MNNIKYSFYRKLTKNCSPLFFKGGDLISIASLATGIHEPEIKYLTEYFADKGYSDFFIDIGANIGLSSCQSGAKFKEIHVFEPNPDCVSILKINSRIALRNSQITINEFGLGSKKEMLKLYVPYNNWGGAFIMSPDNDYNEKVLYEKDGYAQFKSENYNIFDVRVEPAEDILKELFRSLIARGLRRGVVKIDVEGYERTILNAIVKTIPDDLDIFVIFENWLNHNTPPVFEAVASGRLSLYKLVQNKYSLKLAPRWVNSFFNILKGGFYSFLRSVHDDFSPGTYILAIKSKTQ